MKIRKIDIDEKLPSGTYTVVDPSYVFSDWDEIHPQLVTDEGRIAEENGHKAYIFPTADGEAGVFPVFKHSVKYNTLVDEVIADDRWLAIIPQEMLPAGLKEGVKIVLTTNAEPAYDEGDVSIGEYGICTCGCTDPEEDEFEDWDEFEDREEDWADDDDDWVEEEDWDDEEDI